MDWQARLRSKMKASPLMWAIPLLGVAAIGVAVIAITWAPTDERTELERKEKRVEAQIVDSCKQVRLGMTRAEALKIMPEPVGIVSYTRNRRAKEKLLFPSPATASIPPQFIIDGRTDSVEEIACDENYRLRKK